MKTIGLKTGNSLPEIKSNDRKPKIDHVIILDKAELGTGMEHMRGIRIFLILSLTPGGSKSLIRLMWFFMIMERIL